MRHRHSVRIATTVVMSLIAVAWAMAVAGVLSEAMRHEHRRGENMFLALIQVPVLLAWSMVALSIDGVRRPGRRGSNAPLSSRRNLSS